MFSTQGIQVTLSTNSQSNLYAMSTDVYGNNSDCIYFTSYLHDNIVPPAPQFISSVPISPTRLSSTPLIQGSIVTTVIGKPLSTSSVKFYDNLLCLTSLGEGAPADFTSAGISISVSTNTITSVYAKAFDPATNSSPCTFMFDYTFSTNPPGIPQFISSLPASPSYDNVSSVKGSIAFSFDIVSVATVNYFSDSLCVQNIGTGTKNQFLTSGNSVTFPKNTMTSLYAQTVDVVGSTSPCRKLFDFDHNEIGPSNLQASQNQDGSVLLSWSPDVWAIPSPRYEIKRSKRVLGPYTVLAWQNAGTSFTDYAVTDGETYFYKVAASNITGVTLDSAAASITVASNSVQVATSLTASPGPGIVSLQWVGATPNMFYKIKRSLNAGGPYVEIAKNINGLGYSDTSVVNGTTYFYVVVGLNPNGVSFLSNETNATPTDVPLPPANLKATMLPSTPACSGNPGVQLSWSSPPYYTQFALGRGRSSNAETDRYVGANTNFIDCTLDGDPTNYYWVRAIWGTSQLTLRSLPSNEVSITNASAPTIKVLPGNNEIFVKWAANPVSNGIIDSYQIWRSSVSGWPNENYVLLDGAFLGTSYFDTSVVNGQSYYYVIVVNYRFGPSWPSVEEGGIPRPNPGAPSNLTVQKDIASNSPLLTWSKPTHYNAFNIYRATSVGGPYTFLFASPTNQYVDSLTTPGTYYYKIATAWGSYESGYSNLVSYTFGAPLTFSVTATASNINLSWSAVAGAISYKIFRSTVAGGPYTNIATTAGTTYSNTTTVPVGFTAAAGTGYFFVIQPLFAGSIPGQNSSESSGMLTGTQTPSGLSLLASTSGSVNLTWAKVSGVTNYTVYKSSTLAGVYTSVGTSSSNLLSVSSLSSNTGYYFKVATTSCGSGCLSSALLAYTYTTPSAPSIANGNNQIVITWTGVTGATSYNIFRSSDAISYTNIRTGATGGTFTDAAAVNGTLYFYKIQAIFPGGNLLSAASVPSTPGIVPMVPEGISVINNSNGTDVTLNWAAVSGATAYNVYLSNTSGGPWGPAVTSTSSNVGNVIAGLTAGLKYFAVVTALSGSLETSYSNQFSFIPEIQPAAATAQVVGSSIVLSYSAVVGATSYDLFRSIDSTYFSLIANNIAGTTYTDNLIATDFSYSYYFVPKDAAGAELAGSAVSPPITFVLPPPNTNLIADVLDSTNISLKWATNVSPQVTQYRIYRSGISGGPYVLLSTIAASTNQYLDSSAIAGNDYYYVVTALLGSGAESNYSNEVNVSTAAGVISLFASNVNNTINLNWSADANAITYVIKRGLRTSGPYGVIAIVSAPTTSFTDSNIVNDETYFYIVDSIAASGSNFIHSPEANITAIKKINLEVPIELTDQPISSDTMAVNFERTQTSFNPSYYDGNVTNFLEVVASNTDNVNKTISLVDKNNVIVGSVMVPANTSDFTRFRNAIALNASADAYRIQMPSTSSAEQVKLNSARIIVNQLNASKTKLYFPLLASSQSANLGDLYSPTESTILGSYFPLISSSVFERNLGAHNEIIDYNPWEFEVLVSSAGGQGLVGLYNTTVGDVVEATEIQFDSPQIELVNSPFNEGVKNFDQH